MTIEKLEKENEYLRQLLHMMAHQMRIYDDALEHIASHDPASAQAVANEALIKVRGNKA